MEQFIYGLDSEEYDSDAPYEMSRDRMERELKDYKTGRLKNKDIGGMQLIKQKLKNSKIAQLLNSQRRPTLLTIFGKAKKAESDA